MSRRSACIGIGTERMSMNFRPILLGVQSRHLVD